MCPWCRDVGRKRLGTRLRNLVFLLRGARDPVFSGVYSHRYRSPQTTMAKAEYLTISTLTSLASPQSLYVVLYAWLFGMCACFFPHVYTRLTCIRQLYGYHSSEVSGTALAFLLLFDLLSGIIALKTLRAYALSNNRHFH